MIGVGGAVVGRGVGLGTVKGGFWPGLCTRR